MFDLKWSSVEKRIARSAYEHALEAALAQLVTEFKAKAAAVVTPTDMWALEDYLHERRRKFAEMFDYRYSVLPLTFALLIRRGHLDEARLRGLSEEKLEIVRRLLSG